MISHVLYKLSHSAGGIWSAHVLPEECRELLDYIDRLESDLATMSVRYVELRRETGKLIETARYKGLLT